MNYSMNQTNLQNHRIFFEYSNFIENHPPLDDGIEVEFHKEIKFMYKDKIKNKIIYSLYQGECQKGTQIRHGRGFFKWGDGEKYIGYWFYIIPLLLCVSNFLFS